ncbi:uncharacterized protein LOC119188970 [Manduca sexta]|uniref:uncharacterized protein LOC119188970 n=1 Tax=Manduca sexta TaxID=7130 RepID=UPI001890025D|nr:uncharacterized protein LOC119188970 [Manduca sexta]
MPSATLHFFSTYSFDDNVSVHFSFYKFVNNRYTRGFVELHYTLCDIVDRNRIFGHVFKQGKLSGSCPYTAGDYHFYNLTLPIKRIPKSFPYTKARLHINTTATANKELIFHLYVDLEIKEADVKMKDKQ